MMADCLIEHARLAFLAMRANGATADVAAAYADGLLAKANPLELRRSLLTQQREDLQGCVKWATERKLWGSVREYRHMISRVNEDLAIIDRMAADVAAQ
jgi:hypothetical protein